MPNSETATLGGGCFWCLEAVYEQMKGVLSVTSGYMGGHLKNPTYEAVCAGKSGHIEVVQIVFDPDVTQYREILEVFFAIHDPASRDRQGNDSGPQYRSAIFYYSDEQREIVEETAGKIEGAVTEVRAAEVFFPAEKYHQEYFRNNPQQPYCAYVVAPKVRKFRAGFGAKAKPLI